MSSLSEDKWDIAGSEIKIYTKMTETIYWRRSGGVKIVNDRSPSLNAEFSALRAALYLRDNLLATMGERIWGLTFTLYPDGKFKLDYDYNKPEGYEETDETIGVDLTSLSSKLGG